MIETGARGSTQRSHLSCASSLPVHCRRRRSLPLLPPSRASAPPARSRSRRPDYVWMREPPMPAPGGKPIAFHFHYIDPKARAGTASRCGSKNKTIASRTFPLLPPARLRSARAPPISLAPPLPSLFDQLFCSPLRASPPTLSQYPGLHDVISKMWNGDQNKIPCTGPAPVIIKRDDLVKMAPYWEEYTEHIEAHADAKEKLGWVREMYAYSIAAAAVDVEHDVQDPKTTVLISQPPADDDLNQASSFHYTWGAQYKDGAGKIVWEFDKRPYVKTEQVRKMKQFGRPTLPPGDSAAKGYHLQDGKPVTAALLKVQTQMISRMQEAIDELEDLPHPGCGWESEPDCAFGCKVGELCVPKGARFAVGVAGA